MTWEECKTQISLDLKRLTNINKWGGKIYYDKRIFPNYFLV
jgi:hypothetical protein